MKRVVLLTVALALLPAVAAAHDTGPDPTDAHAQIVAVQGNRLYLGSYGRGMHIYDGSDPRAPRRIGAYTPGLWADAPPDAIDYRGRRFAVLNGTRRTHSSLPPDARTDRTEWLDVTHAAAPRLLHTFGPDQVGASCCWPRAANYVGAGDTGSMFVIDITDPRNPVVRAGHATAARPT